LQPGDERVAPVVRLVADGRTQARFMPTGAGSASSIVLPREALQRAARRAVDDLDAALGASGGTSVSKCGSIAVVDARAGAAGVIAEPVRLRPPLTSGACMS
jgi:hypothetical protein